MLRRIHTAFSVALTSNGHSMCRRSTLAGQPVFGSGRHAGSSVLDCSFVSPRPGLVTRGGAFTFAPECSVAVRPVPYPWGVPHSGAPFAGQDNSNPHVGLPLLAKSGQGVLVPAYLGFPIPIRSNTDRAIGKSQHLSLRCASPVKAARLYSLSLHSTGGDQFEEAA
jgi:hypothetical protein